MPFVHRVANPEQAHNLAVQAAKYGIVPREHHFLDEQMLNVKIFDRSFKNPIGCAAGFDKNGEALKGLYKTGFGFVEIGTVTPLAQEGNPKPRVFRLSEDRAVINRYGFNNDGHEIVLERVKEFRNAKNNYYGEKILGINIGKNKLQTNAVKDYVKGLECFGDYADYIVINISSPNTPGLRSLQNKSQLEDLIDPVREKIGHFIQQVKKKFSMLFIFLAARFKEQNEKKFAHNCENSAGSN
jgi:dihydroorotate dehydrogenase